MTTAVTYVTLGKLYMALAGVASNAEVHHRLWSAANTPQVLHEVHTGRQCHQEVQYKAATAGGYSRVGVVCCKEQTTADMCPCSACSSCRA
jgi:hypothetical protein